MFIPKKTNKRAIITFDYEVFLGRHTGTIHNCVIKPTKLILDVLKKNNAKAIFFVDATWLLFLKENFPADFNEVSKQLKNIVEIGSSVELHLHPQWIDARKVHDKIVFDSFKHYRLHSLPQQDILELFKNSIELLEGVTNQKIFCYRAGGFCIEPFDIIKKAFEAVGIKYDFSVVSGMYLKGGHVFDYDFSHAPDLPFYRFKENTIQHNEKGCFVEVPLSTYNNNPIFRFLNKLVLKIKGDKIWGDGIGLQQKSIFSHSTIKNWLKLSKGMLTIDNTWSKLFKFLLVNNFRHSELLVIISHPKTCSSQALKNLKFVAERYHTLNSDELNTLFSC